MSNWSITLKAPFKGLSPKYYKNSKSTYGDASQFNYLKDVDLTDLNCIKQGPAFSAFTIVNTDNNNVYETIVKILDYPVLLTPDKITYGISANYLWSINETDKVLTMIHKLPTGAIGNNIIIFNNYLYYWYNTASNSEIGRWDMNSTYDDDWGSTTYGNTTDFIKSDFHPMCVVGEILLLGNKKYLATYRYGSGVLSMKAIDYPDGYEITDIKSTTFNTYVITNYFTGAEMQIYSNSFKPLTNSDGVITSKIGPDNTLNIGGIANSLFINNGIVYVIKRELYDEVFSVCYLNGNVITELDSTKGVMPSHQHITWYKGFLTYVGDFLKTTAEVHQIGQQHKTLDSIQSSLASIANVSAIANPFGNMLIATSTGIYVQSGLSVNSKVTTLTFNPSMFGHDGIIDSIAIRTNELGTGAGCKITLNIVTSESVTDGIKTPIIYIPSATNISKSGTIKLVSNFKKNYHTAKLEIGNIVDFSITIEWPTTVASTTNECGISEITITGHTNN